MAKYGNFQYGGATYGQTALISLSVAPMGITVLNFNQVYVSWVQPTGTFTKIRLVRNQSGFPETAEDGVIVWEQDSSDGSNLQGLVSLTSIIDGSTLPLPSIPITSGREVYYAMFLYTSDNLWVNAGQVSDIVPSDHGTTTTTLNLLPTVFTSADQNPVGEVDTSSDLYGFLSAAAFTYDQALTSLELLKPQTSWELVPSSTIAIQTNNLGLNQEPNLPIKNQKQLVRDAYFMYTNKGTHNGLQTYIEALTGYAPNITLSSNLLLSVQDSTFYKTVGNWVATGATIAAATDIVPVSGVANQIDNEYTCKITATAAGSMTLGANNPILYGVPVQPTTEYVISAEIKSPTSAGNMSIGIQFFDQYGNYTSAVNTATAVAANNTWKTISVTGTSDATSSYAVLTASWSAAGTFYLDQVCVQVGSTAVYDEARAINVVLEPTNINLIMNPSFEVDHSNWTFTGSPTITLDSNVTYQAYSSNQSLKVVNTAPYTMRSNNMSAIEFGIAIDQYYTASAYIEASGAFTLTLVAADSSGTVLDSTSAAYTGSSSWNRYSLTYLLEDLRDTPALANLDHLYFEIDVTDPQTIYYDSIQVEKGRTATEYFDGNMPSSFGTIWAGTPNESVTYLYPNNVYKIPRVANTLTDWVPPNLFWRISTLSALEFTNLTV